MLNFLAYYSILQFQVFFHLYKLFFWYVPLFSSNFKQKQKCTIAYTMNTLKQQKHTNMNKFPQHCGSSSMYTPLF